MMGRLSRVLEALRRLLCSLWLSPPSLVLLLVLGPIVLPHVLIHLFMRCWRGAPRRPPRNTEPLLERPATELANMIKSGKLTSRHLTELCLDRLRAVNPALNAVTAFREVDALAEAEAADAAVRAGRVPSDVYGALWGVPCVVKECFEITGLPFTAGIASLAGQYGKTTCPAVARLQAAGVVVIASTNVSEGCMFHESANPIYGRTNNPHDCDRTVGGSSGGAAAAVAACAAPLALTSDVGGSTRIPALFNGLYGHKPTGGTVPNTRTLPRIDGDSIVGRYCQLGPTTRHAVDLMPLLRVVAGRDGADQMVREDVATALQAPEGVDVTRLRVFTLAEAFLPRLLRCGLHPEQRAAQAAVVECLRRRGCEVVPLTRADLPETAFAFSIWGAMLGAAATPFIQILSEGRSPPLTIPRALGEAVLCLARAGCTSRHTLPAVGLALVEKVDALFAEQVAQRPALSPATIAVDVP